MAKKAAGSGRKSLVIVESPAKARTISKFLGRDFQVEASIGHVRDLPEGKKNLPEESKKEEWGYLGVNVKENFAPIYVVPDEKKKQVASLKKSLKEAKDLYLATDEDREGEAISWHLYELLQPKVPVYRLVFHEITKEAIQQALEHPREIDEALVKAQETRRILDRLYGYDVSPLLWKKVRPKLSAGRVQSVAVRLIVERERERRAFHSATYWDLVAEFKTASGETFQATLAAVGGKKIPTGKDFDPDTGQIKNPDLLLLDEQAARALAEQLMSADFSIQRVDDKPYTRSPAPPFTTSTMQQDANRKMGFTARRTMQAAQSLYENGHITYMRTDSVNLAQVAVNAARDLVISEYGQQFLPDTPRIHKSKVKNAQEAHEAIRPAGQPFELPSALQGKLSPDEFKLFEFIWMRTIASQMADARGSNITIVIEGREAVFQATGKTIEFPGFLRAYVEGSDDPTAELADQERILPQVKQGDNLDCSQQDPKSHSTQPPARFTEASLTRELERRGIGRPSTYASIIDTVQYRDYVFKKGSALVPSWLAFSVTRLLEEHLPTLVDFEFTAQMEDYLDAISRREGEQLSYLNEFYFGNGQPGLKNKVDSSVAEIDAGQINRFRLGQAAAADGTQQDLFVRVGKRGLVVEHGEQRVSIPEDTPPDELTLEKALDLLENAQRELGVCPDTARPVFVRTGPFGPYVQLEAASEDEKPKNASLLKDMDPADVDLDVALKLLSLPRTLGQHPQSAEPVRALNGRYGPYVQCGEESRSLRGDLSPLDVTLEQALELLAQPKTHGRRGAAPKEPIKVFDKSPITEQPVSLLDGRYGPYVTDGTTNASLPKGTPPEEITFERALDLLAERAAKGPSKKKTRKKAATKKAAKTKASKTKTTTTKAAKTKTTAKSKAAKRKTGKKATPTKS